jgi:hypothetical protein
MIHPVWKTKSTIKFVMSVKKITLFCIWKIPLINDSVSGVSIIGFNGVSKLKTPIKYSNPIQVLTIFLVWTCRFLMIKIDNHLYFDWISRITYCFTTCHRLSSHKWLAWRRLIVEWDVSNELRRGSCIFFFLSLFGYFFPVLDYYYSSFFLLIHYFLLLFPA